MGGRILVTTSRIKDTRAHNFNEEATVKGVRCVGVGGERYGWVEMTEPLRHYHHAGRREYQCEVALLTRNIVIQARAASRAS